MDEGVALLLELADVLRQMSKETVTVARTPTRNRITEEATTVEDPWASPTDASVSEEEDPWGTPSGGGSFPKARDFLGCLILLEHVSIDRVPKPKAKTAEDMQDRLRADTTIIAAGPNPKTQEYVGECIEGMFWSQTPIVAAMKTVLRNQKSAVLGRLARVDVDTDSKLKGTVYDDPDEAAEALQGRMEWDLAWILEPPSEEDKALARKFLKETRGAKR